MNNIEELIDLLLSGDMDFEEFGNEAGEQGYIFTLSENAGNGVTTMSGGYSDPPEIAQADHDAMLIHLVWL